MIHCNALVYNPKDLYNFFGEPWEGKVVQLGGSDVEAMAQAAKLVQDNGYKEVNLNGNSKQPSICSDPVFGKEPYRDVVMLY